MGQVKIQIKKIEDKTNRQVTYLLNEKNDLLNKANELSVLCDIDIALIMFFQNGKLSVFSGKDRLKKFFSIYEPSCACTCEICNFKNKKKKLHKGFRMNK
ncbi:hypothetical protein AMTRI_Chr04g185510 [Amborella trichopoda]